MMKKTTITLLLSLSCCWLAAQCPTSIGFYSQAQVDAFPVNYPGCKDIPGEVQIFGLDIQSLLPLQGITSIGGNFFLGNFPHVLNTGTNLSLKNLWGLDSLSIIGGSLYISDNKALETLDGLNQLKYIGNDLIIAQNHALSSLEALSGLDTIYGNLSIGAQANGIGGGAPVGNNSLPTLDGLHNIRHIAGDLSILSGVLQDMSGLEKLRTIDGTLLARAQTTLESFAGMDSLQSIGKAFRFWENYSNTSFVGLGVQTVENIEIASNYSPFAISGLDYLKSVYGEMYIGGNDSLLSITGFNQLQRIDSSLSISYNNNLGIVEGFQNLRQTRQIGINDCPNLATLNAFNHLDSILYLGISYTGLNDLSGLKNLTYTCGFSISDNASLMGLDQLERLNYCKGLNIVHNTNLASINLPSLKSLGGSFLILYDNDKLTSLHGLDSLDHTTISDLNITQNGTLTFCHIEPICKYLESGGSAVIGNAPGCYSVVQVKSKCQALPTEDLITTQVPLQISPSPARDFLQIQINDPEKWDISFFDLQGRQMFRQSVSGSEIIRVKDWPSGIYVLLAVKDGRLKTEKVVKQ